MRCLSDAFTSSRCAGVKLGGGVTGVFPRNRSRLKGSVEVTWVAGTLTMSDDLSLAFCFAFGLGPSSDRAILALLFAFAFGSGFAFAFGLPLGVPVDGAGCESLGGSPGFHVVCVGARTNRPLAPLFCCLRAATDGCSPCGGSSVGRSSGRSMELSGINEGSRE